ncbi:MAG TPA: DUF2953 domain-containing protein [Oscillospiraceae bacterium]|nr:DUF2953 domain-containing protein [Oscillospiraceae bacterium]
MKWILTLLPLYLSGMLLLQLIPVRINLFFVRDNKDDFLNIRVNTFFSLLRFNVEVPLIQQDTPFDVTLEAELKAGEDKLVGEKKEKISVFDLDYEKVKLYVAWIKDNKDMLSYLSNFYRQAMTIEKFVLRVHVGLNDAALTGLLTGLFWSVAVIFVPALQKRLRFKERPVLAFKPDFSPQTVAKVYFDAVVKLRIGHFMLGSLLFMSTIIRGGKD